MHEKEVEENNFKSKHEEYFSWWLEELLDRKIVFEAFYEPKSYLLSNKLIKLNEKNKTKILLQEHKYTPDFEFQIYPEYIHLFNKMDFIISNDNLCVIEIKPKYNMNNMNRLFSVNQKWVWEKYGIYVQKIIVDDLFENTFIPKRYLKTDKLTKDRLIKYKYNLVDDYINANKDIN